MVIIYGFGEHCKKIVKKYNISLGEVEFIIDNGLSLLKEDDEKIISWEKFKTMKNIESKTIVIGANLRFQEIKKQILESGIFEESHILTIDEWAEKFSLSDNSLIEYVTHFKENNLMNLIYHIGELNSCHLENAKISPNREKVLSEISKYVKGGNVAEVGVAFGDFSESILREISPRKFYAIDLFSERTVGFWGMEKFTEMTHYEYYSKKFKKEIEDEMVELKKGLSWESLQKFPDDFFDYVYLDAAHDYASVMKDIEQLVKKVKHHGIIQFNDYTLQENYGVIPAVNAMIKNTNSKVLYYCMALSGYADMVIQLNKKL